MSEQSNLKRHQHCPMRTHVGNCIIIGGFCTSIQEDICDALHKSFQMGTRSRAKEGEWILECDAEGEGDNLYRCSECGRNCGCQEYDLPNFCYHCGADMRGEEE